MGKFNQNQIAGAKSEKDFLNPPCTGHNIRIIIILIIYIALLLYI